MAPDFLQRLWVTLAALAVWLAALYVPLYGIDQDVLPLVMGSTAHLPRSIARLSIGALGVIPLVSALSLAELVRLIGPRSLSATKSPWAPGWVLWVALAFAIVQAANIAVALEQAGGMVHPLVPHPGAMFRIVCVATLTAGTMLFWWLATQITRHGLGSGVWLLFAALPVADLAPSVPTIVHMLHSGAASPLALLPAMLYVLLSIAAVTFLYRGLSSPDRGEALLWPPLLAPLAIGLVVYVVSVISVAASVDLTSPLLLVLAPAHPLWIFVTSALIVLFVFLHNERNGEALTTAQCLLIAGTLVVITVLGSLLDTAGIFGAIATNGSLLVIATLVTLKVLDAARGIRT